MTEHASVLAVLTLGDLERACRHETRRHGADQPSDERFCLEIFKRALKRTDGVFADEEARTTLVLIYTDLIKAYINRTSFRFSSNDHSDIVQQVWLNFWRRANTDLSFEFLGAALRYLEETTRTTLLLWLRGKREDWRHSSIQELMQTGQEMHLPDPRADPVPAFLKHSFRERVRALTDDLEYWVFQMRYDVGMPPRELARLMQAKSMLIKERPATARAVSDMLDRTFKQLEKDSQIQDLLRDD